MANAHDHLAVLKEACELRNKADFDHYILAIKALRKNPSREILAGMLRCLRDVDAGEVQYELIEACEAYDEATYVREFAGAAMEIRSVAPHWGRLMLQSVLNSDTCRQSLRAALKSAPAIVMETCRIWISEIAADYGPENKYEQFARSLPARG